MLIRSARPNGGHHAMSAGWAWVAKGLVVVALIVGLSVVLDGDLTTNLPFVSVMTLAGLVVVWFARHSEAIRTVEVLRAESAAEDVSALRRQVESLKSQLAQSERTIGLLESGIYDLKTASRESSRQ